MKANLYKIRDERDLSGARLATWMNISVDLFVGLSWLSGLFLYDFEVTLIGIFSFVL